MSTSSQNQSGSNSDTSHPCFLHHSHSLGTVLDSQPLTGDNYAIWSRAMSTALSAKNKICFVDGSLPTLASTSSNEKDTTTWFDRGFLIQFLLIFPTVSSTLLLPKKFGLI